MLLIEAADNPRPVKQRAGSVLFKNRSPEVYKVSKLTEGKTTDFMNKMDREHGKAITSRTWKTVARMLKKMEDTDPQLLRSPNK